MSTASRWRWVWMTALIAAAIASYGVLNHDSGTAFVADERPVLPGYYLKDAILTVTQPDGSTRLRLVAGRIQENVADQSYSAEEVRVNYLALPGQPWTLRSDRARVPSTLTTVDFTGNVQVRSEQNGREGVILTESLTLDTANDTARTRQPVAIEFGGQRINATGLTADLRGGRLQLESRVNGQFQQK